MRFKTYFTINLKYKFSTYLSTYTFKLIQMYMYIKSIIFSQFDFRLHQDVSKNKIKSTPNIVAKPKIISQLKSDHGCYVINCYFVEKNFYCKKKTVVGVMNSFNGCTVNYVLFYYLKSSSVLFIATWSRTGIGFGPLLLIIILCRQLMCRDYRCELHNHSTSTMLMIALCRRLDYIIYLQVHI